MIIENNNANTVRFDSLHCGDVFKRNLNDSIYYMATRFMTNAMGRTYNAVTLHNGSWDSFSSGCLVYPVKCKLVIE